jgi:hypothetical protein
MTAGGDLQISSGSFTGGGLSAQAGGTISLADGRYDVGTGRILFQAAKDLNMSVERLAGRDIFGGAGGAISIVGGRYDATDGRILFSSRGSFTQTSSTNFVSKVVAIDTTGRTIQLLDGAVPTGATADTIASIGEAGGGADISLGTLRNPEQVMLLNAGVGRITGDVEVQQLGVFGTTGSAAMNGTVRGVTGQGAGQLVVKILQPDNNYRFNDCAMGSPTCVAIPAITPVTPRAINDLTIIPARPNFRDTDIQIVGNANEDLM